MDMYEFLILVMLVMGILQIILFFKVWIMTNDVGKIKDMVTSGLSFKEYMVLGDKEKAFESMKEELVNRLTDDFYGPGPGFTHEVTIKKVDEYIPVYIERAKLTGHELPEHLTSGKKFYDYYKYIP